ncbi:MAG: hypothetical protein U0166_22100 [Acidobacteriota bacterium]
MLSQPRYHVPLMPLLLPYATLPWIDGRIGGLRERPLHGGLALALVASLAWLWLA